MNKKNIGSLAILILTLFGCWTGSGAFTEASDFLEQYKRLFFINVI